MAILEKEITINLSNKSTKGVKYYENLGYEMPKVKNAKGKMVLPNSFEITGELIRTFESIKDAKNELSIYNISSVCNGKLRHAGGYRWMFLR